MASNSSKLLTNVHEGLKAVSENGITYMAKGIYQYYHYGCDNFMDQGWGCGYRTLQTLCSWIRNDVPVTKYIPTIRAIQKLLVNMEDKPEEFLRSRKWIGCIEACLVIHEIYNVPCKILYAGSGRIVRCYIQELIHHFQTRGAPIMMGGDQDCSSKCIVGVHVNEDELYLLIVDPHFIGTAKSSSQLQSNSWVKWQNVSEFSDSSFYNFCLPQVPLDKNGYW